MAKQPKVTKHDQFTEIPGRIPVSDNGTFYTVDQGAKVEFGTKFTGVTVDGQPIRDQVQ